MSAKITVKDHGSIRIEGEFELYDGEGNRFELGDRKAISLCRCGKSRRMPFCDGEHKNCGFVSEVRS